MASLFQDNLDFLAHHCLPEEETDDEGDPTHLKQAFHSNLTPLGTLYH